MIKSNLVTIAYEVEDAYKNYYMKWDEFLDEIDEILIYYKSAIYKSGKIIVNKKIGNTGKIELNEIDNEFLDTINYNEFLLQLKSGIINCCNNYDKETLYDQIISIIIGECIVLYKQSQIVECKNLNIKYFKFISDNNCCDACKLLSKFKLSVDNFNISNIHPYCKQFILPIDISNTIDVDMGIADFENIPKVLVPVMKNLTTKLKIQLKNFVTKKKFIFGDFNSVCINENEISIPHEFISMNNFDELIVGELIKEKLFEEIDIDKWIENYKIKKDSKISGDKCIIYTLPFINNIATSDCKEYILQNASKYILNGNEVKDVDINAYNKLKDIFKKEFIKG